MTRDEAIALMKEEHKHIDKSLPVTERKYRLAKRIKEKVDLNEFLRALREEI